MAHNQTESILDHSPRDGFLRTPLPSLVGLRDDVLSGLGDPLDGVVTINGPGAFGGVVLVANNRYCPGDIPIPVVDAARGRVVDVGRHDVVGLVLGEKLLLLARSRLALTDAGVDTADDPGSAYPCA